MRVSSPWNEDTVTSGPRIESMFCTFKLLPKLHENKGQCDNLSSNLALLLALLYRRCSEIYAGLLLTGGSN